MMTAHATLTTVPVQVSFSASIHPKLTADPALVVLLSPLVVLLRSALLATPGSPRATSRGLKFPRLAMAAINSRATVNPTVLVIAVAGRLLLSGSASLGQLGLFFDADGGLLNVGLVIVAIVIGRGHD